MRPNPSLRRLILALIVALSAGSAAWAEGWTTDAGMRFRLRPPYEGADSYRFVPMAVVNIRRADSPRRFVPADGGGTIGLLDTPHFVVGPALRIRGHRLSKGDYAGLDRISVAPEVGAFVDWWPKPNIRGRLEVRKGFGGHHGVVGDAGLDYIWSGQRWNVSLGPRIGFGDNRYMDTYFGVTAREAAASPVIDRAYDPKAGLRYTGGTLAGSYQLTKRWRTTVDLTYSRLASKPQSSPVVRRLGANGQFTAGLGIIYAFGRNR